MSEPEKFFDRWSRRKRDGTEESAPAEAAKADTAPPPPEAKEEAPFDPASLPSIESITSETDIRAFLRPGVPPDLSRAALRRAWSSDPAIRDFVGLVENGWDFNDPTAMPGFGPIDASEVARLLAGVIGAPLEKADEPQPSAAAEGKSGQDLPQDSPQEPPLAAAEPAPQLAQNQPAAIEDSAAPEKNFAQRSDVDVASQNNSDERENVPPSRPRGHGGALPK
jgi:hypothetical protein